MEPFTSTTSKLVKTSIRIMESGDTIDSGFLSQILLSIRQLFSTKRTGTRLELEPRRGVTEIEAMRVQMASTQRVSRDAKIDYCI